MKMEIFEMDKNGNLVKVDNPENGIAKNLPTGSVLHWGGNMGWNEEDLVVVARNDNGGYGIDYTLISIDSYNVHHVSDHSIKSENDPKLWHSQHFFITGKTLPIDDVKNAEKMAEIKMSHALQEKARKAELRRQYIEKIKGENPGLVLGEGSKNIKKELKKAFPNVKFSVRQDHGSVNISWSDGPMEKAVEAITGKYQNGHFDGMTDSYKYAHSAWCEVFGGFRFVSESRHISNYENLKKEADALIRSRCTVEGDRFGNEWIDTLTSRMVYSIDFTKGDTLETAFRRAVLREEI